MERANRTHTEEFYEVTDAEPELEAFQVELRAWERTYDTIRRAAHRMDATPERWAASLGASPADA